MAARWWVNADADNNWNNANNWSATEGGAGGAGIPTASDDVKFSNTSSNTLCQITAAAACLSLNTNSSVTGGTDNFTNTLDCNANLTVSGDMEMVPSSTILAGAGTIEIAGNAKFDGTFTRETSTLKLTGTSKTLDIGFLTLYNVTIAAGATITNTSYTSVTGTTTVETGATLTTNTDWGIGTATATIVGTMNGSGRLALSSGTITAGGTINCDVTYQLTYVTSSTLWARTYGRNLDILSESNSAARTITVQAGTVTVAGGVTIRANGSQNVTVNNSVNNATWDIGGNIDFVGTGGGTEIIQAGSGTWNVAGNIDLTAGTLTAGTSEFILDSVANKTITSAGNSFYNLTSTNASASPGVTFADAVTVTSILKCITANAVLTFTSGTTSVINDINLNGQAVGTHVIIRASTTSDANWTLSDATPTKVSYVTVSYNNASSGVTVDASDGTNTQGTSVTNWNFGGAPATAVGLLALMGVGT